jgi:chemotaxis protein CheD
MLPIKGNVYHSKFSQSLLADPTRYGNWAMEYLINEILKYGGVRRRLELKIFGGGCVLRNLTDIGEKNIQFALQYIYNENLTLLSQDVGDIYPRKILYLPATGVVKVKKIQTAETAEIIQEETIYLQKISDTTVGGSIELF